ncbi:hypothetical protein CEXT_278861 [Caerostris extrusa]|uniref:Uncharacterized protein n=1 Tax=Caerostris extrusa TaxID=172846 RepID=A0AAV4NEY9_CAEEX|nr:hypothetical protein CEXT_278861 [Caerostris extrusa]
MNDLVVNTCCPYQRQRRGNLVNSEPTYAPNSKMSQRDRQNVSDLCIKSFGRPTIPAVSKIFTLTWVRTGF